MDIAEPQVELHLQNRKNKRGKSLRSRKRMLTSVLMWTQALGKNK